MHFNRENMKHLLGIHKLNDIKGIATLHSKKITSTNNRVTDTICNSNKIHLISDRITYFNKIFKFLNRPQYIKGVQFKKYNPRSKIESDFLFYIKVIGSKELVVFLHVKVEGAILIPVSFYDASIQDIISCKKDNVYSVSVKRLI